MAKKKKGHPPAEERGESAPLWVVSFADLVVLLLSFFVILSSTAGAKNAMYDPEFADLIAAIKKAFGYIPPSDSTDPIDLRILRNLLTKSKGDSGTSSRKGEARRKNPGVEGRDELVKNIRKGTEITIGETIFFPRDTSELTPQVVERLKYIAGLVRGHTNVFVIKGHTSHDEEYQLRGSTRDLAYDRARAVESALLALGVARESLRLKICRDKEPLKEGVYTDAERDINRRVEVVATEALVADYRGERPDESPRVDEILSSPAAETPAEKPSAASAESH